MNAAPSAPRREMSEQLLPDQLVGVGGAAERGDQPEPEGGGVGGAELAGAGQRGVVWYLPDAGLAIARRC